MINENSVEIKLTKNGPEKVWMHPSLGIDELIAASIMTKVGFTQLEGWIATPLFQSTFGFCMALTDHHEGFDFEFPTQDSTEEEITQMFMNWLHLPGEMFNNWYSAVDGVKRKFNNDRLLPPERVGEELKNDPLPSSEEESRQTG